MCVLAHLADFFCFYRIAISIALLFVSPDHAIIAWLFGFALLTDILDGWCFRHFTQPSSHWLPWNPLMATTDQLADLAFVLCGASYVCRYCLDFNVIELIITVITLTAAAWALAIMPICDRLYTTCATLLHHSAALLMLLCTIGVWRLNSPNWLSASITNIALYYLLFLLIGDKSRLIRRDHLCC